MKGEFRVRTAIGQLIVGFGKTNTHDLAQCRKCFRFMYRRYMRKHVSTSKSCTDRPYSFVRKPSTDKFFCYLCGDLFGKDLLLVSHLINDHADQSERLERIGIGLLPLRK